MKYRDQTEQWIGKIVKGRSFVDIGGIGVDSVNERISVAIRSRAAKSAMADIRPFGFHEWETFEKKMAEAKLSGYDRYDNVDINDPLLHEKIPRFDVVHCTGIFYHLANPVLALHNVRQIVGEHLIINTVTIPEKVENENGSLTFDGNTALFLPGISEHERSVLRLHYQKKFVWDLNDVAPRLGDGKAVMPYYDHDGMSCWPYWWLFTDAAFRSFVSVLRFEILDEWKWEDHALSLLTKKIS